MCKKLFLVVLLSLMMQLNFGCIGEKPQLTKLLKQSKQNGFGMSIHLDGVDDVVRVPDHPALNFGPDQNFTISAMFKSTSVGDGRIVCKLGDIGYAIFWDYQGTAGRVEGVVWTDEGNYSAESLSGLNDGQWHQVAMVRSGEYLFLYIDGEFTTGVMVSTGPLTNSHPLYIGADPQPDDGYFFEGEIDEVRIWNKALFADEIKTTSTDTLGREYYESVTSGLVAYYRFDTLENLGIGFPGSNDVRDLSVNGIHGELLGGSEFLKSMLTLQFNNMSPHIGQRFEVRVVDMQTSSEVGRKTISAIENSRFEMVFYTTIPGHSYRIEFYADHNNNGTYDAPPTDHAWFMELLQAQGNDTLSFEHHPNFTDIEWQPAIKYALYSAIWTVTDMNTSDGSFQTYIADVMANFNNQIIEMILKTDSSGLFPWLELYFTGRLIIEDDSIIVIPNTNSTSKVSRFSSKLSLTKLQQNPEWYGTLTWRNSEFSGDIGYNLTGNPVDVSVHGTLGATQAILSYQTDSTGAAQGIIIADEDTVLTSEIVTLVNKSGQNYVPGAYFLSQNYPNPFNPVTTIAYTISNSQENTHVKMDIYNIQGQLIRTLLNENMPAGQYSIQWDGTDDFGVTVSSGVYFYQIRTEAFQKTKKMILMQ